MSASTSIRTLRHFIDGEFVSPSNALTIEDVDPATRDVIALIPQGNKEDVEKAVRAARSALIGAWGKTNYADRASILEDIASRIQLRLDEFAELECLDTGKPIKLTRHVDIPRVIDNLRFFSRAMTNSESAMHEMPSAINYTLRKPVGVVALITPWNLPLYLLTWKLAPALIMGNTIVAKPSEMTPLSADLLCQIASDAGLPKGVLNVVHGLGSEAGQALCEHPDVDAVSFTGGTATGKRVAMTAAPMFKKLSLELGGKNPTLVFADAHFDKAVEGACRAAFTNQGQICLCGSRIFVERSIEAEFTHALVKKANSMKIGNPRNPDTDLGSLISAGHREKVMDYVDLAKEEGGEILCGGRIPELPSPFDGGAFFEPTIIAGLSPRCRTAQEEIFGPVVTLHPFEDEEEAVTAANDSPYGLSASLWTKDLNRAHRVSRNLETGMVWVNTWLLRDLRVPFGGVKQSGVGREGGRFSLEFFSETKNVCINTEDDRLTSHGD